MRLIDIINAPWAITPEMLDEIQAIYVRHMRGDKIDLAALSASTGIDFSKNESRGYQVHDGVALLAADGVIAKRLNLFSKISGGVSSELLGRDFSNAMNDREVAAVVLAMDSPGGTVDGTPELAGLISSARGIKPIITFSDGQLCSAAYWIGSAADRVLISSDVVMVGSIGVVAKHVDISEAERRSGVTTTEVYAGKYKRIASQHAPLSAEGRATIQQMVDHVYGVFVDTVAEQRGASAGEVIERMADGRVFHGRQAIEAGLVDGVSTLAEAMEEARALARRPQTRRAGVAQVSQTTEVKHMDKNTFLAEHADLAAALADAGVQILTADEAKQLIASGRDGFKSTAEVEQLLAAAKTEGAEAERVRIADVRAQAIPGHEALIERLAFDGVSTGADAAKAIVAEERKFRSNAEAALDHEANGAVPPADPGDGASAKTIKRAEFTKLDIARQRQVLQEGVKVVD